MKTHKSLYKCAALLALFLLPWPSFADDIRLEPLIEEALGNNHRIFTARLRHESSGYRIGQARSLPEPMLMLGYQNEGWSLYTYGDMEGSMWMTSVSQMIPFPGKRPLKGRMAEADARGLADSIEVEKQKAVVEVKERFFDLLLIHKSLDLVGEQKALLSNVEELALSRYASGASPQQDVLMARTEKSMLAEKEEMLRQKRDASEAMLNAALGRDILSPLGRPVEPKAATLDHSLDELLKITASGSPEVLMKQKMTEAAEYKIQMAKKEYYPDMTLAASVFDRGGPFEDMWSLTASFNIPLFYKSRQRNAVAEAVSARSEARHDLEDTVWMLSAALRENYFMARSAENLMKLYRRELIPLAKMNYESALSGYKSGKVELSMVVKSLSSLIDFETLYYERFVEGQKAVSRVYALSGIYR